MFVPQPIHELAVEALAKGKVEELILLLKVLGNAGHPASLKPILKLLPGFGSAAANLPLRVQIDAVLALRNIAKREPKMVRLDILTPYIAYSDYISGLSCYVQCCLKHFFFGN